MDQAKNNVKSASLVIKQEKQMSKDPYFIFATLNRFFLAVISLSQSTTVNI